MTTTPVSIRLTSDVYDVLANLAKVRQRTVHWLMSDAINKYAAQESRREIFRKETLKAWEEYAETGLHVTLDEVAIWAESWGSDNEQEAPKCHE